MTLLTKVGSSKIDLITGRDNLISVELENEDDLGQVVPLDSSHSVTGNLVTRDVDFRLVGPFQFSQDADNPFVWKVVIPKLTFDAGVLVNPEAPDTRFVQEITRERSLCYLQLHVSGSALNEPYLIDTRLQRGFS